MGFLFALLLIGLPLAAAYIDMLQAKGVTNLGGFDLPATGGYTPKWNRTVAASAPHPAASPARPPENHASKSVASTAAPATPGTIASSPDIAAHDTHERPDVPSSG